MLIPHRGTLERAWIELNVELIRAMRLRQVMRWMARQRWVNAYAEWAEKHVPSWFTPMNVVYLGFALYAAFVLFAVVTGRT